MSAGKSRAFRGIGSPALIITRLIILVPNSVVWQPSITCVCMSHPPTLMRNSRYPTTRPTFRRRRWTISPSLLFPILSFFCVSPRYGIFYSDCFVELICASVRDDPSWENGLRPRTWRTRSRLSQVLAREWDDAVEDYLRIVAVFIKKLWCS